MHGVECVFPKRTDGHALWSKSACMISRFCRVQLFVTLWTRACQAPRSMGFSSQEYWSGLPRPPPGQLPDPGTKSASLPSHALAGRFFFTTSGIREAHGARVFLFKEKNSFRNQNIQGLVGIPIPFLRSRYSSGLRELRVGPASSEAHTGSPSWVGYKELIFHTIQPVKMQQPSRSGEQSNSPAGFYSH